jgi:phytoene synthase
MQMRSATPLRPYSDNRGLPGSGEALVPSEFLPAVAPSLDSAYEHCRRIARSYGKTYYFSTCFFPPEIRPAVHALYAWVRYPDEWVDNPGDLTRDDQIRRLRDWRAATRSALSTGSSDHPVLLAWTTVARRYGVPLEQMEAFLDAMECDLTVDRYPTFDALTGYTWGSASVVGLMMCRLIGASEAAAVSPAANLGLAMQLTNFLRDIGEDWRDRGRLYLPLEDLDRFGVSLSEIAEGRVTPAFRELMRFEIDRTRAYYALADDGFGYIPDAARRPVRLARVLYARILDKIEQNDYDVFSRRARVPTWEKLLVLAQERRDQVVRPRRDA